jgi:hypothetical protein
MHRFSTNLSPASAASKPRTFGSSLLARGNFIPSAK